MAHDATLGSPGARKGALPARTVAATVVACLLAFSAVFWAHSVMTAQAVTFNGMRPPYPGYTPARDMLAGVGSAREWEAAASAAVAARSAEAQLHEVEGVRVRQYIRVVVHVRDEFGNPVPGRQVIVVWHSRGIRTVESCVTNQRGDGSVLHWVPAADRGQTVVCAAWSDSDDWANGTYAWFVPK